MAKEKTVSISCVCSLVGLVLETKSVFAPGQYHIILFVKIILNGCPEAHLFFSLCLHLGKLIYFSSTQLKESVFSIFIAMVFSQKSRQNVKILGR